MWLTPLVCRMFIVIRAWLTALRAGNCFCSDRSLISINHFRLQRLHLSYRTPYLKYASFFLINTFWKNVFFLPTVLLNVKIVDEKCTRSVYYTTRWYGLPGKRWTCILHTFYCKMFFFSCPGSESSRSVFVVHLWCIFRFICENCLKKSGKTKKENKFTAKSEFCSSWIC